MDRVQWTGQWLRSDPQFRVTVIQWAVLVGVLTVAGFAIRNVAINLTAIGKDFSFAFLLAPASYDITFSPFLEYSSRDTHLRAALVGLLNTVLVAVTGIAAATVLGFAMGIARLSRNWLVNRTVYVILEFVRNVPLLLHILWIHGAIVSVLPTPRAALGIGGVAFVSNRGLYLPAPVAETGFLAVAGVAGAGVAAAAGLRWWALARQRRTGRQARVGVWMVALALGPTAAAFVAAGAPVGWEVPRLAGFNFDGGIGVKPEFLALWAALSVYTGCFVAEAVRGGIVAVGKGQMEAGLALGLRPLATLRLVVVPQAARVMAPPIVNQYLNLTKDSSLAIAIGYMDVVATIGGISLMQTGRELETMTIILGVYLALSLAIALSMNRFHRTTRRRAGRETQARAQRTPSVAVRYDEAVAVREVDVRRIGVGSLGRLWEAGEQACEAGVAGVLRLRWREPGRWRDAVLGSREALEEIDLSRAVAVDFEGLEIRGKSHRIWIRERAPVTMLGVVTARPNHLEVEVRGSEVRSCVEVARGLAGVCQSEAGTPVAWRCARAAWIPALAGMVGWQTNGHLSGAYAALLDGIADGELVRLAVWFMSLGCGLLAVGIVVVVLLTSPHVGRATQYLRVSPERDWAAIGSGYAARWFGRRAGGGGR